MAEVSGLNFEVTRSSGNLSMNHNYSTFRTSGLLEEPLYSLNDSIHLSRDSSSSGSLNPRETTSTA